MTTALTPETVLLAMSRASDALEAAAQLNRDALQRIKALEAELAKLAESECDKIMAMSEDQIAALTRMQGSNPDDVDKIARMACELALKDFDIQRLEAELAHAKQKKAHT